MLGDNLKILREEKNLTQAAIAKILNISPSTIGMWEQNRRSPDNDSLKKLADFFDVTIDFLLGKSAYRKFNPEKLTEKDKKDIQNDLKNIIDDFRNKKDEGKYYNGVELDDDGLDLMEAAMNIALEQIKIKNKKKYTPNKYKK
ncbi:MULTISPECIES: helix-turn-helix domain-containing protein [Clostridium]|uniref:Helix-turn-helix transcriptional regulator n=1 Tax=Clostridium beijerinckii TaxID=1520 RepID=A0AAW3W8Y9_CLOBE|nr:MULTISPECIES: helix-turn-helix transcriptional regulator [Clostridium]MBC2456165.1 helix-turn-helix transcriptional regulator [Clostridium beijerinckii]MBC2475450.1 helix-turn-helix transcriptional regulator [Clostridium beijerinckii]MBN7575445.1 helix-turn-helix transcriptional regulator [Clostridium beijerinckii]MBN7580756.1 helix-turn-helix transcriptional regulator [Clostridium beijerinckii]MBN7585209.1 helix-turn-helix transcriptional regulator [Clostridium beijerinckii]